MKCSLLTKTCVLFAVLFGLYFNTKAQEYGNEWVNYNQVYYRVAVNQTGIHRLTFEQLQNAGFPSGVNVNQVQLFFRGKEQAIILNSSNGIFDAGDFIEFYGQRNDGTLDALMYRKPEFQTNPYRNIYSDFTYVFVTVAPSGTRGRRMQVQQFGNGGTPQRFYQEKVVRHFTDRFSRGQQYPVTDTRLNSGGFDSDWINGKGYTGAINSGSSKRDVRLAASNVVTTPFVASVDVNMVGWSNTPHNVDILAGPSPDNQRVIGNLQFNNFDNSKLSVSLRVSDFDIESGEIYISYKINPVNGGGGNERVALSTIELYYLRNFNANGNAKKAFPLPNISSNTISVTIENVGEGARLFDLSNEEVYKLINGTLEDSTFRARISGARGASKLWLDNSVNAVSEITQITLAQPKIGSNYLIVTGEDFFKPSSGFDNVAQAYATYRSSQEGGSYTVDLQDFENLRNLFSYGEYTPLAIRRYIKYMYDKGNPEFLFLLGKSMDINFQYERRKNSVNFTYSETFPCWGEPCSDNLLSANIDPSLHVNEPALATGRVSTDAVSRAANYLKKLMEYESNTAPAPWEKQILHLSGGRNPNELVNFRGFVDSYKSIVEGKYLGASVATASKRTTSQLEFVDIVDQVNEGIGLMTFFGHSGLNNTVDISIGNVNNSTLGYDNTGRYPMMFINGCLTGNVYDDNTFTMGENWISVLPNQGAISFIAHSDLGYSLTQHYYTTQFYNTYFKDSSNVNESIGKINKKVINTLLKNRANDELIWSHVQQYVLQGDPAVRLFPHSKPDYEISDESVSAETFFGEQLSSLADSFRIAIDVKNLGIYSESDFDISVLRTYDDGTTQRYAARFYKAIPNNDRVYFTIRNSVQDKLKSPGINSFEIKVDFLENVEEAREDNNVARLEILIPRGGMDIITPREFSIQNQQPINILAQNKNLLDKPRNYIFEIDTTNLFNSPIKKDTIVFAGLTPSWGTTLLTDNNTDSTVYYIRTRYAQLQAEEDTAWAESSFLYIQNGPEGWSQSHFPQYRKNPLLRLVRDDRARKFNFLNEDNPLTVTSIGSGVEDLDSYKVTYNGFDLTSDGNCGRNKLITIKFDVNTGVPYSEDYFIFATPISCGLGTPGSATYLDVGLVNRFNGIDRVINDSNVGDPILFFVAGNYNFSGMEDGQWNAFERIGGDVEKMRANLKNGDSFIIFGRKGMAPGEAQMFFADTTSTTPRNQQTLVAELGVRVDNTTGNMTSTIIGPALRWDEIHYTFDDKDNPEETRDIRLSVIDNQGNEGVLINSIPSTDYDISFINPDIYPYIKLTTTLSDAINNTPTTLRKWQVYYKEAPEGILFYQARQDERLGNPDSLNITLGAKTDFAFKFQNVSSGNFDEPLIAEYQLRNLETNVTQTYYDTLQTLAAGDSILFNVGVPTEEMEGRNRLRVYVNPKILPEKVYENNIIEVGFNVIPDNTNPVLDVVFDGIHIMDGEIVSPTPMITVSLKDENEFLIRNDTTGIELFLAKCEDCSIEDIPIGENQNQFEKINFNDSRVNWTANENNDFQVFFQPDLEEGKYVFVAQGEDLSGNTSGVKPYRTRFEVITESTITNFYPYPNPFSDNVRFVFTLTGREIPEELKIQIMTVSGRVVREITQDELGPIRAGNNISEYAWDGKDEFGDQLANGVYLYRIIIPREEDMFEHRETAGDNLFKNGFGKLYLLR